MVKRTKSSKDFEWTPKLAYAVGLLVTDGCLSSDGRHIVMRSKEKEQLNNFKKCLGLNNMIGSTKSRDRTHYRVQFGNVQLYDWLQRIGLFPNKTYTMGSVDIPDVFFRDFMRGHLDGDGSITSYVDKYNVAKHNKPQYVYIRLLTRFISASKDHIDWLQHSAIKNFGVTGAVFDEPGHTPNRVPMWILKYSKKESLRLLEQLYYSEDLICLSRKREKAERSVLDVVNWSKTRS